MLYLLPPTHTHKHTHTHYIHPPPTHTLIQVIGSESSYGPRAQLLDTREGALWLAVKHPQKKALEIFSREIAPAGTGMCE